MRSQAELAAERGPLGIRVVQGLLSLSQRHTPAQLDRACTQAVSYGTIRLADVRRLLAQPDQKGDGVSCAPRKLGGIGEV